MKKLLLLSVLVLSACSAGKPVVGHDPAAHEMKIKQLLTQGLLEIREDNPIQALAVYEVASELSPRDPRVVDAIGTTYFRMSEFETAKKYFQKAIELEPKFSRAYGHLALVVEIEGDKEAALGLYEMAVERNPLNYRARRNLAELAEELGYTQLAAQERRKARIGAPR